MSGANGAQGKTRRRAVGAAQARERAETRQPITDDEVPHLELLGTTLRTLRVEARLTQQQLADAAELSRTQVRRIEHGTRRTRRSTLGRIADALADDLDDDADRLAQQLEAAAGPALADESDHAERVAERRDRRHTATHVEVAGTRIPVGQTLTMTGAQAETFSSYLREARPVKVGRTIRYVRDDDA